MKNKTSVDVLKEVRDNYYHEINIARGDGQTTPQVKARAAFAVALMSIGVIQETTAKVVGRDRSTMSHYSRMHRDNLVFWPDYKMIFDTALKFTSEFDARQGNESKLLNLLHQEAILERRKARLLKEMDLHLEPPKENLLQREELKALLMADIK
tara:strand:+ start:2746 stop:3207 length:462 start_codon:yes stop_codon:yes gene_type:complete